MQQIDVAKLVTTGSSHNGRRSTILTLIGPSLIFVKLEDHDIRAPILGMGREVARSRHVPVLVIPTSNLHDFPRTVLFQPVFDLVNGL
jgi:hypothetical protein